LSISNDLKGSIKKGDHTWSSKAVLKTEGHAPGSEMELTVNAKEVAVKYGWEPEQLNHDKTVGGVELEFKHGADSSIEANATLMAGGYNVGGAIPFSSLGFNLKRGAPSGGKCPFGYQLSWSQLWRYDDFMLGYSSTFDDIKADRKYPYIESAHAFAAYTGAQNAFFRSACLDRVVSVGTWGSIDKTNYAAEAILNLNKGYKDGLSETLPVNLRLACSMPLSHGMKATCLTNLGSTALYRQTLEVPLRDHLKMKVQGECDVKKLVQEPAVALPSFGATFEYKL